MKTRTEKEILEAYHQLTNRWNGGAGRGWSRARAAQALGFTVRELELLHQKHFPATP